MLVHSQPTIDNVTWTALKPAIDCHYVYLLNIATVPCKIRTDNADPNTEITIQPLQEHSLASPIGRNVLLQAAATLAFAQLTAGSEKVLLVSSR